MGILGAMKTPAAALLSLLLLGCSPKAERMFGPVKEVIGIDGEYFPVSAEQRIAFKGNSADAQAVAMILVRGVPCDAAKWQGRAWINLHYADDRTLTVHVAQGASVAWMGDDHLQIRMPQLVAILERLTAKK
jgi:hypothetical protein